MPSRSQAQVANPTLDDMKHNLLLRIFLMKYASQSAISTKRIYVRETVNKKLCGECAHPQASKPASQPATNQPAKPSGRQPSQHPSTQIAQASPAHPNQVSARSHTMDNPFPCAFLCKIDKQLCECAQAIQPIANRRPARQTTNQQFRIKPWG